MGDLVTEAVSGTLYFAEKSEFDRVARLNSSAHEKTALFADLARLNTLYMIANAGSGHIGSSFSSMDIVAWLYLNELKNDNDVYFSSKGHDAPGLYAVLMGMGRLSFDNIDKLRQLGGLPGHPDVHVEGMETNTGSLGMGVSKAKGMAFAFRRFGQPGRIFVMTGDGELQEGQIWESLISAANDKVSEITVIVDHNKIQSDYSVERTSSLGDLAAKFSAFGWHTQEIDGHDLAALDAALRGAAAETEAPSVIIAHTVKGKGVSFMEGESIDSDVERFKFHSGAPQADDYTRAAQELIDKINARAGSLSAEALTFETVERPSPPPQGEVVRLFPAYTQALLDHAAKNDRLIALDADLVLDMGLEPFRDAHPDRFIECGIAEMDMVSQAGGMALKGLLPVVHSFSCFLSTRPNEQIYNNATEHTKIVYVGGLSGVIPAGPGHSHQSVREISTLGSIPNFVMLEPGHPDEVAPMLDWCLNTHDGPSYLRLTSIPYRSGYHPDTPETLRAGQGWTVREGGDAVIFTAGLAMLAEACTAAEELSKEGVSVHVVNMPWLNVVDAEWLASAVGEARAILVVENHYTRLGLGDTILSAWSQRGRGSVVAAKMGLLATPPSGRDREVLDSVGLDAAHIGERVRELLAAELLSSG